MQCYNSVLKEYVLVRSDSTKQKTWKNRTFCERKRKWRELGSTYWRFSYSVSNLFWGNLVFFFFSAESTSIVSCRFTYQKMWQDRNGIFLSISPSLLWSITTFFSYIFVFLFLNIQVHNDVGAMDGSEDLSFIYLMTGRYQIDHISSDLTRLALGRRLVWA